MTIYVITPTRRASAEAVHLMMTHALGEAGATSLVSQTLWPRNAADAMASLVNIFQEALCTCADDFNSLTSGWCSGGCHQTTNDRKISGRRGELSEAYRVLPVPERDLPPYGSACPWRHTFPRGLPLCCSR